MEWDDDYSKAAGIPESCIVSASSERIGEIPHSALNLTEHFPEWKGMLSAGEA